MILIVVNLLIEVDIIEIETFINLKLNSLISFP